MESGFKGLRVYQLAYKLAMEIFSLTKTYPKDENYSLVTQIRRSSRSVCANIAEGYRRRKYPKHFSSKLTDADTECTETLVWLDFSKECNYLDPKTHQEVYSQYEQVGHMLGKMINNPDTFLPKADR